MRVVITGGAGFLGSRLARKILERGTLIGADGAQHVVRELVLFDMAPAAGFNDPRVTVITGDVADAPTVRALIGNNVQSVFHLAAIVSGQAEAEFDLGMRINFDATRHLLEAMRALPHPARLVFSSSLAVFGAAGPDDVPDPVRDDTALTPLSSYGAEKAMGELLVNDYSRKGFVDGRALRLPTVTVRPGKPNAAASSFASGIIREPLNGVDGVVPVGPDTRMWVISPRGVIDSLLIGHEVEGKAFGSFRAVSVPGMQVRVGDMADALRRVAGPEVAARVKWQFEPRIDRIVCTWPSNFDCRKGLALGMKAGTSFDDNIREYIADEKPAAAA
ncbi:MAG: SDR family oxidoreductase [Betaproteobacteria bacterium]|nr:SDR family oxidoreductase [Betaproteobacteria bacterium]